MTDIARAVELAKLALAQPAEDLLLRETSNSLAHAVIALAAEVERVTKERDDAREALRKDVGVEREQLMFERDVAIGAQLTMRDKLAELRERAEYATDPIRIERDAARAEVERLQSFISAFIEAREVAYDKEDDCACDNAIHDTTNTGECPWAEAEWTRDLALFKLRLAIDTARQREGDLDD